MYQLLEHYANSLFSFTTNFKYCERERYQIRDLTSHFYSVEVHFSKTTLNDL